MLHTVCPSAFAGWVPAMRSRGVYTLTCIADCKCLVLLESICCQPRMSKISLVGQVGYSPQKTKQQPETHETVVCGGAEGGEEAGRQDCTVRATNEPSPTMLSGARPRLGRGKCASRTAVPFSGQSPTCFHAPWFPCQALASELTTNSGTTRLGLGHRHVTAEDCKARCPQGTLQP